VVLGHETLTSAIVDEFKLLSLKASSDILKNSSTGSFLFSFFFFFFFESMKLPNLFSAILMTYVWKSGFYLFFE